jgi:hypothetical protein
MQRLPGIPEGRPGGRNCKVDGLQPLAGNNQEGESWAVKQAKPDFQFSFGADLFALGRIKSHTMFWQPNWTLHWHAKRHTCERRMSFQSARPCWLRSSSIGSSTACS